MDALPRCIKCSLVGTTHYSDGTFIFLPNTLVAKTLSSINWLESVMTPCLCLAAFCSIKQHAKLLSLHKNKPLFFSQAFKMTKSPLLLLLSNTLLLLLAFLQSPCPVIAFRPTNETDKLALLAFKDSIHEDPLGVMDSWNESFHFCDWRGVSCSKRHEGRVTMLNLASQKLVGSFPPHIGNLSFMRHIDLDQNYFKGEIPQEIGHLFRLKFLNLSYNGFQGKIPSNLSSCSNLEYIDFVFNELIGEFPIEIGNLLTDLRFLGISRNQLTGDIPQCLGNASSLEVLSLGRNNFRGSIPNELGRLAKLEFLQLGSNQLSGKVPLSIFNLSSLSVLAVAENQLHGRLPSDIGFTLPNLQYLFFALNSFYGEVPPSLVNATELVILDMGGNNFTGAVPSNIGNLKNLVFLSFLSNKMESTIGEGLGFITSLTNCTNLQLLQLADNQLEGELPTSIANLSSKLQRLMLGENHISGEIPKHIGNLVGLTLLGMYDTKIIGEIPTSMGKLKNLSELYLGVTRISGSIPSFLGNLSQLQRLSLDGNNLSGFIPPSLGNCSQLQHLYLDNNYLTGNAPKQVFSFSQLLELNLGYNLLTGEFPLDVGNMSNLVLLNVSNNRFSGRIPSSLGNCLMLGQLLMVGNLFEGGIPPSFIALKSLNVLDLSRNNLSGEIPKYLQNFTLLQYLNLSFNDFAGELPTGGVFGNASIVSLAGNQRLCGGIHQLGLPPCKTLGKRRKDKLHRLKVVLVTISCSLLLIGAICLVIFSYLRKSRRKKAISTDVQAPEDIPRITYAELSNATNGFSSSNVIGEGSFGSVYKGILGGDGMSVAVKVLNLLQKGASKSFIAECEALRNIRHRNLIKIVTVCSSIDFKGVDFKALVYEFMQNGNVDEWLHPNDEVRASGRCLSFTQRLNIAIGVACALQYLHDHCTPPIVHGDLKPSNVLLDGDMVAHVGDFGLARFLSSSQTQSSSIGIKGTIGYIPPEYGMNRKASKPGDVYAFGILLLEMITGKRPTDAIFKDSFTIHQFTKTSLPERVVDVLQHSLLQEIEDAENPRARRSRGIGIRETLLAFARIGVLCSMETPNERMEMKQVAAELCAIRDKFIGNRRR